jgi:exonuclease VII small subunit
MSVVSTKAGNSVCSVTPQSRVEPTLLEDHRLQRFWPSERRALLEHHAQLCRDLQRDVDLEEAVECWENGGAAAWRRAKMRLDGQRQLVEIERHKYFMSQREGRDIGWEAAAKDWIAKYAAPWREWWEEQVDANPPLARRER